MSTDAGLDFGDDYTSEEERLAESIREAGGAADNIAGVGVALAGAFLLYRLAAWRRLQQEAANIEPEARTLYELNSRIFRSQWMRIAWTMIPALISGYRIGLKEAGIAPISEEWLERTAQDYALDLAESLHTTSSQALVEGFQAQLNRRVAARKALDNTIDAFGVAPRTMRAVVNVYVAPPVKGGEKNLTAQNLPDKVKQRADSMVAKAIVQRAQQIGETESFAAKNSAKSIVWLYLQQRGDLPRDATKMWITAKDERVCPVCGPLHKVQVPLDGKFPTSEGEVWAPSLHPRCRCDIVLRGATQIIDLEGVLESGEARELTIAKSVWGVVSKARGGDPYDRDRRGRFAAVEERSETVDPAVARLMQQIQAMPRDVSASPRVSATPTVSATRPVAATPKVNAVSVNAKQNSVSASKQTPSAVKPRIAAQSNEVKARSAVVSAKIDQLVSAKTTNVARAEAAPTVTHQNTDKWVNTPDNKPMYGIFKPDVNNPDSELLWADDEVEWYTAGEGGRGIPSLQAGVDNYWKNEVLSEHAVRRAFQDDAFTYGEISDDMDEPHLIMPYNDMELYVPFHIYQQAWKASVFGLSRLETPEVMLHASFMEYSEEDDSVEFIGEDDIPFSLHELAAEFDIPNRVRELKPIVAKTTMVSTDADGTWGGIMTNPGKWRVTHTDRGPSDDWHGRDQTEPFPYTVVSVEPEDR